MTDFIDLSRSSILDEGRFFFSYSRQALQFLLQNIDGEPGGEVLLPAYICDVVPAAIRAAGWTPVYYGLTPDLNIDERTLRVGPRTRALLSVNYFGYPADFEILSQFTRQRGLLWINDNAHGFGSRYLERSLSDRGDVSLTSLWKSLPVLFGAEMRVDSAELRGRLGGKFSRPDPRFSTRAIKRFGRVALPSKDWDPAAYESPENGEAPELLDVALDWFSLKLLLNSNERQCGELRHSLAQLVHLRLRGRTDLRLMRELAEGVAPLSIPVKVSSEEERSRLLHLGHQHGLEIHSWPHLPQEVISQNLFGTCDLWRSILLFPLHQRMSADEYGSRVSQLSDYFHSSPKSF